MTDLTTPDSPDGNAHRAPAALPSILSTQPPSTLTATEPPARADTDALEVRVRVQSSSDIVQARRHARAVAALAGFSPSDVTLIATALSEIARNIVEYAGDGEVVIGLVRNNDVMGVRMTALDSGPGIVDIDMVMRDGYSSGGHLGMGLPGARRLVDVFEIESSPGSGTRVTMTKWVR